MSKTLLIILFLCPISLLAWFGEPDSSLANDYSKQGQLYINWGWNRTFYMNSDIRFRGDGYDYSLSDLSSRDRQVGFSVDNYLNPKWLLLPQTNARIGYSINDNYTVSVGLDRMNCIFVIPDSLTIAGEISGAGRKYSPMYDNEIAYSEDFIKQYVLDGISYLNFGFGRSAQIVKSKESFKLPIS
ncbi:MAG: hypothetical protein HRT90_09715, partial [Candidatus Margulisbacteria bacterium]|nr:hypothetical protein [Candidatus Margulisiibacteriota bacterium]